MQQRKLRHESKTAQVLVGCFVVVAVFVFVGLLLMQHREVPRYDLIAEFNSIQSLSEAATVKLRGFPVGRVERIEFRPQAPAGQSFFLVHLGIEKQYLVMDGTVAEIRGSGLVGETFVALDVTDAENTPLTDGARLEGRDGPGMKALITSITDMAQKLGGAGETVRTADLGSKLGKLTDSIQRISTDLGRTSQQADSLFASSRSVVEDLNPRIQEVVAGLGRNMDQLNHTLVHTDTLVAATSGDIQRSVRALRMAVERLDRVLQRVDRLARTKETEIDETLSNLHAASAAVREISHHPWKLITGQGASGVSDEPANQEP